MVDVGFGTGSLYKQKILLDEILDFYKDVGATAVEISLGSLEEFKKFKLTEKLINKINEFSFVSFHAPFRNIKYDFNDETKGILEKLDYLSRNIPIFGVVIHPDIVTNCFVLENSRFPFLIENMNPEKKSGKSVQDFHKYNCHDFGYVLDIEHVYGNDHTMKLANELIEVMGSKLHHLHVSGKKDSKNHTLCYLSENKSKIGKILRSCQVPRISEGILSSLDYDMASKEIEFLKQF